MISLALRFALSTVIFLSPHVAATGSCAGGFVTTSSIWNFAKSTALPSGWSAQSGLATLTFNTDKGAVLAAPAGPTSSVSWVADIHIVSHDWRAPMCAHALFLAETH